MGVSYLYYNPATLGLPGKEFTTETTENTEKNAATLWPLCPLW